MGGWVGVWVGGGVGGCSHSLGTTITTEGCCFSKDVGVETLVLQSTSLHRRNGRLDMSPQSAVPFRHAVPRAVRQGDRTWDVGRAPCLVRR